MQELVIFLAVMLMIAGGIIEYQRKRNIELKKQLEEQRKSTSFFYKSWFRVHELIATHVIGETITNNDMLVTDLIRENVKSFNEDTIDANQAIAVLDNIMHTSHSLRKKEPIKKNSENEKI